MAIITRQLRQRNADHRVISNVQPRGCSHDFRRETLIGIQFHFQVWGWVGWNTSENFEFFCLDILYDGAYLLRSIWPAGCKTRLCNAKNNTLNMIDEKFTNKNQ